MTETATPIFIFADDLLVYATVYEARRELEPWFTDLVIAAYGRFGNVLAVSPVGHGVRITLADPSVNRHDEFVRQLRDHLLEDVVLYPDQLGEGRVERADESELIGQAIATHQPVQAASLASTWGCLGALLLSMATLLMIVVGSGFAAVAATARWVKGKR